MTITHSTLSGSELHDPKSHASGHLTGGGDEIDGDKLDIDWTPSNYTPATTPTEADNADNLTAHLYGIDQAIGAVGGGALDLLIYRHTATQNTAGGGSTSGSDQTLPVTEETVDTGGNGSLSSNQITLAAGTYRYDIEHQFVLNTNQQAQIWLYNVSDTADIADSESQSVYGTGRHITRAVGRFTIASSKTIEIRYRVSGPVASYGLGAASNFREEVYGIYRFEKE